MFKFQIVPAFAGIKSWWYSH